MGTTAHPRGVAETVPIEHETTDRVVRTLVFGVPPAALVVGGVAGVGRSPALARPARARDHLHAHRTGHHRRLSPALHPPQLQDHAPLRALLAVLGSMAVEGPVDRVGRHPSQAPPLLGPPRRPAQPSRRPCAGMARCAARARPRACRLDVPRQGQGQPPPLREGSARRPRPALHQPHLPALGGGRARPAVRPRRRPDRNRSREGSPACCGAEPCGSSSSITRRSASTRCATSSAGDRSPPAITHATSPGSPRSPSGRPGTTTTTPSRPPPGTDWAAGSSTPAPGSSPPWSAATWPGTWSGSAQHANKPNAKRESHHGRTTRTEQGAAWAIRSDTLRSADAPVSPRLPVTISEGPKSRAAASWRAAI